MAFLFYVAVDDHKFAIIGDEGIDKVVPDDFWESIKDEVINEFVKGNHSQGLVMGILHAGEKLKNISLMRIRMKMNFLMKYPSVISLNTS